MALLMIATTEWVKGKPSNFIFVDLDSKKEKLNRVFASYEDVQRALKQGTMCFRNLALDQNSEIKAIGGDLSRYTQLSRAPDANGAPCLKPLNTPSFVIASETDTGYVLVSHKGEIRTVKEEVIVQRGVPLANGKIVERDGEKHISAIRGTFEKVADRASAKIKTPEPVDMNATYGMSNTLNMATDKQNSHIVSLPAADTSGVKKTTAEMLRSNKSYFYTKLKNEKGVNLEEIPDKHSNLSCMQKLNRLMLTINYLSPIYAAILHSMTILATRKVSTMGVNLDTLVLNPDFFADMSEPEALFVLFHEVGHVLYGHVHRRGDRDPQVWNLAADMIVNAMLVKDMNCKPGQTVRLPVQTNFVQEFSVRDDCIFNEDVDPDHDNVDAIYAELIKTAKSQPASGSSGSQSQQGNGSGSQGSGSQGSGSQSSQSQQGSGSQGSQQSQQNQQQSSQGTGSGAGTQQSQQQGSQQSSQGSGTGSGSGQPGSFGQLMKTTYSYKGKEVTSVYHMDIDDSQMEEANKTHGKDVGKQLMEGAYKDILARVSSVTKRSRGMSSLDARADGQIRLETAPMANWRTLLVSKLQKGQETYFTYSAPDRHYLSQDMIVPGPKQLDNALNDLIVAIDVSGSIGQDDLDVIAGHLWNICKTFQVKAHVVYWDTEVIKTEDLKRKEDVTKLRPPSGGGTSVNSFITWYNKLVRSPKGYIPCATIVVTDGWIEDNDEILKARRGANDFIWLIVDESRYLDFKPPYGKKAIYRR